MRAAIFAYISGLVTMAVLDGAWLTFATKTIYKPGIGQLMTDKPVIPAAVLFYLIFVGGLTYLVTLPAVPAGLGYAATRGAVLGLIAYGTYDLTSQAVMRGWPVNVTVIDMIWGTILTAITATVATYITRKFG